MNTLICIPEETCGKESLKLVYSNTHEDGKQITNVVTELQKLLLTSFLC